MSGTARGESARPHGPLRLRKKIEPTWAFIVALMNLLRANSKFLGRHCAARLVLVACMCTGSLRAQVSAGVVQGDQVGKDKVAGDKFELDSGAIRVSVGQLTVSQQVDPKLSAALSADLEAQQAARDLTNDRLKAILQEQKRQSSSLSVTVAALNLGLAEIVRSLEQLAQGPDLAAAIAKLNARNHRVQLALDIPPIVDCTSADGLSCIRLSALNAYPLLEISSTVDSPLGTVASSVERVVFACSDPGVEPATYRPGDTDGATGWISVAQHRAFTDPSGARYWLAFRVTRPCARGTIVAYSRTTQGDEMQSTPLLFVSRAPAVLFSLRDTNQHDWVLKRALILPFYLWGSRQNLDTRLDALRIRSGDLAISDGRAAKRILVEIGSPPTVPPRAFARALDALDWDLWAYRQLARHDRTETDTYCVELIAQLRKEFSETLLSDASVDSWGAECEERLKRHLRDTMLRDTGPQRLAYSSDRRWTPPATIKDIVALSSGQAVFAVSAGEGDAFELRREIRTFPLLKLAGGAGVAADGSGAAFTFEAMTPFLWGFGAIGGVRDQDVWAGELRLDVSEALFPDCRFKLELGGFAGATDGKYFAGGAAYYAGVSVLDFRLTSRLRVGGFSRHYEQVARPGIELGLGGRVGKELMSFSLLLRVALSSSVWGVTSSD